MGLNGLNFGVERGPVRFKCPAQECNILIPPVLEPRPLDPESSALIIRPLHLHTQFEEMTLFTNLRSNPEVRVWYKLCPWMFMMLFLFKIRIVSTDKNARNGNKI